MPQLKLYNSLTRAIEEVAPQDGRELRMFVCGPTVYDYIHLGNARTFVIFDTLAKYLRHVGQQEGFTVRYLQNITDLDDRIIQRATDTGRDALQYAAEYTEKFLADATAIGITAVDQYAKATDHIPQVLAQVQQLKDKGHIYEIPDDGWYFDLKTFADYGKLSGRRDISGDDAVSRIDDSDHKRNPGDFCVWKFSKPGEPTWPAPFGNGRPGWHIEDTATTEHYFGPQYDLHGGGRDLLFPHHEAEITQQESASGKVPFVRHWVHAGFLENKSHKMSKSLGNFTTLHEALERWPREVLRFYFLSAHYRAPLDFADDILAACEQGISTVRQWLTYLDLIIASQADPQDSLALDMTSFDRHLADALNDDFNTPIAISTLFSAINSSKAAIASGKMNAQQAQQLKDWAIQFNVIFGIVPQIAALPADVVALRETYHTARESKDWARSDSIRQQIVGLGYAVDDTPYGPLVRAT